MRYGLNGIQRCCSSIIGSRSGRSKKRLGERIAARCQSSACRHLGYQSCTGKGLFILFCRIITARVSFITITLTDQRSGRGTNTLIADQDNNFCIMTNQTVFTLVNQQNGNLAFKLFSFEDNSYFDYLQRNNYYSVIWVTEGNGKLKTDFSEYNFEKNSLFSFTPYQPFMFSSNMIKGVAIYFHSDFFCIHKHQTQVTCNGVMFNNVYEKPFISVDEALQDTLN